MGKTTMICAAMNGHYIIVDLLLDRGANIDDKDTVSYDHIHAFLFNHSSYYSRIHAIC